ncbi:MAG: DNA-binding domain-containing protein [Coxiellaceae bacterium]|nr:DNA-binding domain-containing protein [Coxiellaceae bacterium]
MAIFNRKDKSKSTTRQVQQSKLGHSIKVVDIDHLLGSRHHQKILTQVKELSLLEGDHFRLVYDKLIRDFAAYVQVLPATMRGGLSGLLNESLFSAYYNLKALVAEKGDSADALLRYAVFSGGLLRRVSHIVERFRVVITDDKGHYVKEWNAFDSDMLTQGAQYYKLFPMGPLLTTNHTILMGMIIRLLMPKEGFEWIANDTELFHEWLNAMETEDHLQGRVGSALAYILREDNEFLIDALPDVEVEQIETPDTIHGESLYLWIKRNIEEQNFKINTADALLHIVNNGLFIEYPGLVREFVTKVYAVPVNFNVVFQQFGNLFGLTMLSGDDFRNRQFFSDYPGTKQLGGGGGIMSRPASTTRQGVVIPNAARNFYMKGEMPNVSKHLKAADNHPVKNANALPAVDKVFNAAKRNNLTGGRKS